MKFRIYITFETGDQHLDTDWCNQDTLMSSLRRLLHGPVARMNIITEIKVVDLNDCTVFLCIDIHCSCSSYIGIPSSYKVIITIL